MEFTTRYLGFKLRSPLIAAPSPLSEEVDNLRRMEDAGAGAVVLHSLFEEQIVRESLDLHRFTTKGTESFAESLTYFPELSEYRIGPEEYLDHVRRAKEAVRIPVIGSLNGSTVGGWTKYATRIQEAGADALELNIYYIPTDPALSAENVEDTYVEILKAV
jgi:dihydroorotate dehydrogenase (fumarate)